jgi:hypothetical protein
MGNDSGTGGLHPQSFNCEKKLYGEFLMNAQGEVRG